MYVKSLRTTRTLRKQNTKSTANYYWRIFVEELEMWSSSLSHKKRGSRRCQLKFRGRTSKIIFVGNDTDRHWIGKRFIIESKGWRDYPKFLKRLGWRKQHLNPSL